MQQTEQVPISTARVSAGEIGVPQLSVGYLAALAAATGRPLITAAPRVREESDWSDYDNPREKEYQEWGDEAHGLRAILSGPPNQHGLRGAGVSFWVFLGLPAGLQAQGQAKLHGSMQSYAKLTLEGDEAVVERVARAFRDALAPDDVRGGPDGAAIAAVEEALTLLARYGKPLDRELAPPLEAATAAVPVARPAGAAARYLLACIAQATGDLDGAARLLAELEAEGDGLRFSHGVHCGRAADGTPEKIAWQGDVEPPAPHREVQLSLGWVRERQGRRKDAVACYKAAADAGGPAGEAAKQQLKRLKVK